MAVKGDHMCHGWENLVSKPSKQYVGTDYFHSNPALACLKTAEVLSEEPILKWYKDAHLAKGKSVFLEQMKKFVEWLKNAEEGN